MENKSIFIERIDITAFGALSAISICPGAGMNLLECANESGKSTLASFIKFVLYGFKGRSQSISDNPKKMYLPWSGAPACGSLTLNVGGCRIRVERTATASTEKTACVDLQSGAKLYEGLCPGEEIFGVGQELFEKSAFLSSLDRPEGKDEALAKALQGLFSDADSADEATSAVKLLTKQKNALQGRAGAGEIPALEKLLVQLSNRLERESAGVEERRALEAELEALRGLIAEREADMERLGEERDNAQKYEAVLLLEEYTALLAARSDAAAEVDELGENVPTEAEIKRFKEMKKEKDRLAAALEEEKAAQARARRAKKKKGMLFLAATALFGFAAGFLLAWELMIYAAAAIALAVVFCIIAVVFMAKNKETPMSDTEKELADIENELECAMAEYGGSAAGFDADIERMTDARHEAEMLRVVLAEKEKSLAAFLARNDIEELRTRAEGAVKPLRDKGKIEFEYQFAMKSAMGLRQKESDKKSRLAVLMADGADVSATETELIATRASLEKKRMRYNALCLAIEGLNDAEDELRGNVVPRLAAATARLFAKMTAGKYDKLELDNKLFMSFESDYGMKSAEHLSAGSREGLYLCMRLALLRMLYGDAVTPMLLDDALSKQDDGRLAAMLSLLCDEGRQCLLFCCTDRERKVLDSLGKKYNTLSI